MSYQQSGMGGLFQQGRLTQQQAEAIMQQIAMNQGQAPPQYSNYTTVGAVPACSVYGSAPATKLSPSKPKELSLFTEIGRDIKSFVLEHRSTLYFLALALILDHVLFKDAFRHRLQSIVDKIITKVEDKVAG